MKPSYVSFPRDLGSSSSHRKAPGKRCPPHLWQRQWPPGADDSCLQEESLGPWVSSYKSHENFKKNTFHKLYWLVFLDDFKGLCYFSSIPYTTRFFLIAHIIFNPSNPSSSAVLQNVPLQNRDPSGLVVVDVGNLLRPRHSLARW